MEALPAVTGKRLLKLLVADGWIEARNTRHGVFLQKPFRNGIRTTVVKNSRAIIPAGTLAQILGPKQTGLTRAGLRQLIQKYGL